MPVNSVAGRDGGAAAPPSGRGVNGQQVRRRALAPDLRCESARACLFSAARLPGTDYLPISAIFLARRGQCGWGGQVVRAGAAAWAVELAALRALSASARGLINNHPPSMLALTTTRPKSRQINATTQSSVVELTKNVHVRVLFGRARTVARCLS